MSTHHVVEYGPYLSTLENSLVPGTFQCGQIQKVLQLMLGVVPSSGTGSKGKKMGGVGVMAWVTKMLES